VREDLASMVGTATESLVRMLKQFKKRPHYNSKRSIFIEDFQGLVQVSDLSQCDDSVVNIYQ
jgi:hypothetical protein